MKEKILKSIISFFIVMFCCTLIARGAASMTVAKVTTDSIKKGNLTQRFQGNGKIVVGDKEFQSLPEGQKVARILVPEGTEVKKAQPIVQLDLVYLQERIKEKKREIEKTQILLQQQEIDGKSSARVPATEQANLTLLEAANNLETAKQDYAQAEAEYMDALKRMENDEQTETDIPVSEEEILAEAEQPNEDISLLKEKMDTAAADVAAAEQSYKQSQQAYELAQKEEAAIQSNEATRKASSDLSKKGTQLELEGLQEELSKLEQIEEAKGIVAAQIDGVLESVGTVEGSITMGTEQIIMETGVIEACGILPSDQIGTVKSGDEIQIRVQGESQSLPVKIERFGNDKDGNSLWFGNVDGSYRTGTEFSYEYSKKSESNFEKLIPLSALHEAQGIAYVLIAEIRSGILGNVYTAVKIPVTVLEKDDENAAVQTSLSEEALIITQSNKYVKEGDRVRLSN